MWKGIWQGTAVMAKVLKVSNVTSRISREFGEEFPRLRIFSHPNIHPVLGCVNQPPNLVVLSETLQHGSLFHVLHEASGECPFLFVFDFNQKNSILYMLQ